MSENTSRSYARQRSKRKRRRVGSTPVKRKEQRAIVQDVEITGELDAHAAEAFWLELRRLVKRYGAEIKEFRIGEVADDLRA